MIVNKCSIWRPVSVIGMGLALSACGVLPSASDEKSEFLIDRQGVDVIAADAGRQLTYLKDQGAKERFCRGPLPDFSRTAGTSASLGVPTTTGATLGVGNSLSKGTLDLGGRDPLVLIARELLYRACELATNTNADPATEREIYNRFLAAVVEISKVHLGSGSSPLASEPNPQPPIYTSPPPVIRRPYKIPRGNPHDYDDDIDDKNDDAR